MYIPEPLFEEQELVAPALVPAGQVQEPEEQVLELVLDSAEQVPELVPDSVELVLELVLESAEQAPERAQMPDSEELVPEQVPDSVEPVPEQVPVRGRVGLSPHAAEEEEEEEADFALQDVADFQSQWYLKFVELSGLHLSLGLLRRFVVPAAAAPVVGAAALGPPLPGTAALAQNRTRPCRNAGSPL